MLLPLRSYSILIMPYIEKSIEKLFHISRFLLIFPLKLDKNGFHCSPWLTIFCIVHLLFLTCATIRCFLKKLMNVTGMPFAEYTVSTQIAALVFCQYSSVLTYWFSIKRLTTLLRELKDIDALLFDYLTTLDVGGIMKHISFFATTLFVLVVIDVLSFQDETFSTSLVYWTLFLSLNAIYHFVGLLDIFLVRLSILNRHVEGMTHLKLPPLRILVRLTKICRRLSECVVKTNEIYSFQLLSYFFAYFVNLAAITYYIFTTWSDDVYRYIGMNVVLISWIALLFFSFYTVLSKTHNVVVEVKEFNSNLYQLMLCDETGLILNDKTLQLQIASKREVILTAAGFFKLDLTLLVAMLQDFYAYGMEIILCSWSINNRLLISRFWCLRTIFSAPVFFCWFLDVAGFLCLWNDGAKEPKPMAGAVTTYCVVLIQIAQK